MTDKAKEYFDFWEADRDRTDPGKSYEELLAKEVAQSARAPKPGPGTGSTIEQPRVPLCPSQKRPHPPKNKRGKCWGRSTPTCSRGFQRGKGPHKIEDLRPWISKVKFEGPPGWRRGRNQR